MMNPHPAGKLLLASCSIVTALAMMMAAEVEAGLLQGSFAEINPGSNVNLTAVGPIDWVHWGLYTETSQTRKDAVLPQISDFTLVDAPMGFAWVYQYSDNANGYSWVDGNPVGAVTNTTTGVWAYGTPNLGSGFQFTVPAGTNERTLKVFVGVYGGGGTLHASLSDGSAPDYQHGGIDGLINVRNGPSAVYTIKFAANSPGQLLTVRWTLSVPRDAAANVTLQAAALSAEGANNPPNVRILDPRSETNLPSPADILITATAADTDGSVSKVEFFSGGTKLGEDLEAPYEWTWSAVPPGRHTLTAVATDDGGQSTPSMPVDITVYTAGGSLSASEVLPPQSVNLTSEGSADWAHWGWSTNELFNRKAGVTPLIDAFEVIGTNTLNLYTDNYTAFSWTDGAPTASTTPVTQGVFLYGRGSGFEFQVPADPTPRTLRVYAGLYGAQGHFEAWLTDFSAPTYHSHSLSNFFGNDYGVFTIDYTAASAGKALMVRYVAERLFDGDFGNVTLQAATVSGGTAPLEPVQIINPRWETETEFSFSFPSVAGRSYVGQWREVLGDGDWTTFVTAPGTGELLSVTNANPSGTQRFYRIETK